MLTKINRQDCLNKYKAFPLRSYDYKKDEDFFFYPTVFKSYILTVPSKSFKGHIKELGIQFTKLTKQLQYDSIIFLGDTEISWLHQDNDYKPVKEALQYLANNKVGKRFNGALEVDNLELVTFIKHLSWLTRCNASLPYFHFTDKGQNFVGNICQHGNLHIDTLSETADGEIKNAIGKSKFQYLDGNNCYKHFDKSGAILGRQIVV